MIKQHNLHTKSKQPTHKYSFIHQSQLIQKPENAGYEKGTHPEWNTSPFPVTMYTHTHSHLKTICSQSTNQYVFEKWEETHIKRENMQNSEQ